jgi:hypothetical protein
MIFKRQGKSGCASLHNANMMSALQYVRSCPYSEMDAGNKIVDYVCLTNYTTSHASASAKMQYARPLRCMPACCAVTAQHFLRSQQRSVEQQDARRRSPCVPKIKIVHARVCHLCIYLYIPHGDASSTAVALATNRPATCDESSIMPPIQVATSRASHAQRPPRHGTQVLRAQAVARHGGVHRRGRDAHREHFHKARQAARLALLLRRARRRAELYAVPAQTRVASVRSALQVERMSGQAVCARERRARTRCCAGRGGGGGGGGGGALFAVVGAAVATLRREAGASALRAQGRSAQLSGLWDRARRAQQRATARARSRGVRCCRAHACAGGRRMRGRCNTFGSGTQKCQPRPQPTTAGRAHFAQRALPLAHLAGAFLGDMAASQAVRGARQQAHELGFDACKQARPLGLHPLRLPFPNSEGRRQMGPRLLQFMAWRSTAPSIG